MGMQFAQTIEKAGHETCPVNIEGLKPALTMIHLESSLVTCEVEKSLSEGHCLWTNADWLEYLGEREAEFADLVANAYRSRRSAIGDGNEVLCACYTKR